jgi:CRP-like cAMP-binding protein
MTTAQEPTFNRLLSALPPDAQARIFPKLKRIELPSGTIIDEAGQTVRRVYFPTDSIVSLLHEMLDGATAEVAVVGNEGVVGIAVFMGAESTPNQAVVQSGGLAFVLPATELRKEFHEHAEVRTLMLSYTQVLITQMAQTAACNRHHTIEQQLCRWLLLSLDRLPGERLKMTQELIANMLGVRREGVTEAAGKLQRIGVIEYTRGLIHVVDRERLERLSCECYEVVRREAERLSYTQAP